MWGLSHLSGGAKPKSIACQCEHYIGIEWGSVHRFRSHVVVGRIGTNYQCGVTQRRSRFCNAASR